MGLAGAQPAALHDLDLGRPSGNDRLLIDFPDRVDSERFYPVGDIIQAAAACEAK